MALSSRPSVGLFPTSFPRDPISVNVYLEHILLGQIIEPLVESGPDGTIIPAVASSWQISPDGLTIRFFLKNKVHFSNGKLLDAEDVKYTLERHINSPNSQSKSYLKRTRTIEVASPDEIVLHLKAPYVAMLKALSRDHLGIVPKGWTFDSKSPEPFIGTGAYRAHRENDKWVLKKNPRFRDASNVGIPEWDVVFQKSVKDVSEHVPDLVPFAYEATVKELKKTKDWQTGNFLEEPVTHFFQSSAWWYPLGKTFNDSERKSLGMCAMEEFISARVKKINLHRATGLIPEGIAGHARVAPKIDCSKTASPNNREFTIVALSRERLVLDDDEIRKAIEEKYGIRLKILSLELQAPESALTELKPDIFVLAFAGGFHDPEGFLTVITAMLCTDLKSVFQTDYPAYLDASSDTNWETRSLKYQAINQNLVTSLRMVPGWRVPAQRIRNEKVVSSRHDLRYTAKLKDYKLRKEEP